MAHRGLGGGHCLTFCLVELRGLEPLTPCLQSDVSTRVSGPDLRNRLSLSDRHVPLRTGGNDAPMFVKLFVGFGC
jgi:hypothetical protein